MPAAFDARFSALRRHYVYRVCDARMGRRPAAATARRRLAPVARCRRPERGVSCAARRARLRGVLQAPGGRDDDSRPAAADMAAGTDDLLRAEVSADAFCHSMVRSLVGALLAVGEGRKPPYWPASLLSALSGPARWPWRRRTASPWSAWTIHPTANSRPERSKPATCAPSPRRGLGQKLNRLPSARICADGRRCLPETYLGLSLDTPGDQNPVKSSLFGERLPGLVTTLLVAAFTRPSRTCCGVAAGLAARNSAAAPATCGVAIEVPLIVLVAVSLVFHDDVMPTPGAKMSSARAEVRERGTGVVDVGGVDGDRFGEPGPARSCTRWRWSCRQRWRR